MLDQNMFELLNKEVDGTATPSERSRIRKILEKNSEARRTIDELRNLAAILKSLPQIDPPTYLKTKILNAIHLSTTVNPQVSIISRLNRLIQRTKARSSFAFVGGAIAGILLFVVFTGTPSDTSSLVGTMGTDARSAETTTSRIVFPESLGTIEARSTNELVHLSVALNAKDPVDVILGFPTPQLQFESVRASEDSDGSFIFRSGEVRLNSIGEKRYTVVFRRVSTDPVTISATITARGETISRESLTLQ